MIVPDGSNGDEEPKSTTKSVFLEELCLALGSRTLAVDEAEAGVRFTSTVQGWLRGIGRRCSCFCPDRG